MSSVEQVALWAGLIASIISVVLSIVAIVFAVLVDRSARQVSAQTIKSLQKIESEVERSSSDTRELIKAGWDKMLGTVQPSASTPDETWAKEVAGGIAAELRAELKALAEPAALGDKRSVEERLDQVLDQLESALAAQVQTESTPQRPGALVEQARTMLEALTPEAKALAVEVARRHISRQRFTDLGKGPLSRALEELRRSGVLVPLAGLDKKGKEIPVYYYPSRMTRAFRAAISLITPPPDTVCQAVREELKRVGYYEDV